MPKVSDEHLAARRRQILDAALTCFDRDGFHGTSMPAIFAEAGLSAGAVYRYFSSKHEIVMAIAEDRHRREAALMAEALTEADPKAALHRLTDLYFGWLMDPDEQRRRRVGVRIWAEAVHDPEIRAIVQRGADQRRLLIEFLESLRREGRLVLDAEPDALTRIYLALFQGFILQQAWEPDIDVTAYRDAVHALIDVSLP